MALTVSQIVKPIPVGDRWLTISTIGFDSSFAAGGEALTRATLGFSSAADASFAVIAGSVGGYVLEYDLTNQKLLAYWVDTSTDGAPMAAADTADLSLLTAVVVAFGKFRG